jgi:hypothetical protein
MSITWDPFSPHPSRADGNEFDDTSEGYEWRSDPTLGESAAEGIGRKGAAHRVPNLAPAGTGAQGRENVRRL